ncbi:BspA family leucine-rich repeat surface protein [Chryseobacterium formosus]|uniref:BspA family leucine-rich repeat surface protein n=1 Tax=Chryseobacterium formosus TaxID=1537363 RepID=A0ABT3XUR7_9FLAO|nr:BspA family leucine-rich repeat surface protein [Chryseobacterium formosus]MCX8525404.1 BspA family leucine-rich repeat surface protein [Chryseobacterium formosus]
MTGLVGNTSFSSWNTSTITNMAYMFGHTPFNQPIGNWDISNVTDIKWMFHGCNQFNQPLNNWNTSNIIRMDHAFHFCSAFNQDLSNWKTSKVTNLDFLFGSANIFNQNLGDWDLSSVINGLQMLSGTNLNCNNWDKTLFGWANNPNSPSNFTLGNVATATYSHPLAVTARYKLITIKGWTFSGDIYDPTCESVLSTSETILKSKISIYPNPATDFIYLKNLEQSADYIILDFSGKIVLQGSLKNKEINIKNLSRGNYILQVKAKDWIENFKFIKK